MNWVQRFITMNSIPDVFITYFGFKGQLISEWHFDVLNFPKYVPMQKFDEFLP